MPGSGGPALSSQVTRSGSTVCVALTGELDLGTAPALRTCLAPLVLAEPAPHRLVLDLSGLVFLDPSGISALLTAQRALAERGGQVVLRSPSRLVRRVLKLLDLDELLPVEG